MEKESIYMKMKTPHDTAFTSVHIFSDKYDAFKKCALMNGMTLQKLVNRCVYLYNTDETFREQVNKINDLQISGSSF